MTVKRVTCFTEDDWELGHRKLAGLLAGDEDTERAQFDEWLKKKGFGLAGDDPKSKSSRPVGNTLEDDYEDELDREEVCFYFW